MFSLLAIIAFGVFTANVAMAAFWSHPFMNILGELGCLSLVALFFVVAILQAEAKQRRKQEGN